jgi:hypothetical protein
MVPGLAYPSEGLPGTLEAIMHETACWTDEGLLSWPPGQERRAARRRAAELWVGCRLLSGEEDLRQARVSDVSMFGAGVLLPGPLPVGARLHLDFAAATRGGAHAALARVVHAVPGGETCLVGCAFVRELGDEALGAFRAARVAAPPGDARRWARFPCDVEAVCYSADTTPGERSPARVLDASAGGVGLLLPCEFGPGSLLVLDRVAGEAVPRLLLRVVRAVPRRDGDWVLGCEFADLLRRDELEAVWRASSVGSR